MTAAGYVTDVAYIPGFYPQMAPVAMRYVAALNGVVPPQTAEGFRYLELGCGLGRSLTTLAAAHPAGRVRGRRRQSRPHRGRRARHRRRAASATHGCITADFGHLPDDLGTFDFIALHGVFSWVAPKRARRDPRDRPQSGSLRAGCCS